MRLGDVADIYVTDETQRNALRAIELCPTPPAGSSRFLRAREIQELLVLRGVNLGEHRLSGASQVEINGGSVAAAKDDRGFFKLVTPLMERP